MLTPVMIERPTQPYVGIRAQVTMQTIDKVLVPLGQQVFGWLKERGITPAGPPFWKFNVIDMMQLLEVEAAVPIATPAVGDDRVLAGVLPAGRYATVRYTGHPDGIINAVADLRGWAEKEGLAWDMTRAPDGEHWAARLQIHETDPAVEPDMTKWITQLAFRLAD
jgi:effector-binding domain-containing protein